MTGFDELLKSAFMAGVGVGGGYDYPQSGQEKESVELAWQQWRQRVAFGTITPDGYEPTESLPRTDPVSDGEFTKFYGESPSFRDCRGQEIPTEDLRGL